MNWRLIFCHQLNRAIKLNNRKNKLHFWISPRTLRNFYRSHSTYLLVHRTHYLFPHLNSLWSSSFFVSIIVLELWFSFNSTSLNFICNQAPTKPCSFLYSSIKMISIFILFGTYKINQVYITTVAFDVVSDSTTVHYAYIPQMTFLQAIIVWHSLWVS